ncbi:MAG: alpha/beta fold hydrolase [Planctomycetia bacterium]|nr:alpha/beta fold hydrolase [Planctomycetia bacterium]
MKRDFSRFLIAGIVFLLTVPIFYQKMIIASAPKDVLFVSELDGSEQRYIEILPDDFSNENSYHLLIGLHGHGADRWQYINAKRGETDAALDVAKEQKMIFISPDYRAATSWMGPAAEADLLQIIKELKQKYQIDKIFLTGGSMGGTSVLTFAALHPELIDGVASQNGLANHFEYEMFQDAIAESFGGTKAEIPEEYKKRSSEYFPEKLTMPLGITLGGRDTIVPPDSVLRLVKTLQKMNRKVLLIYRPEGGHETDYNDTKASIEFVMGLENKE